MDKILVEISFTEYKEAISSLEGQNINSFIINPQYASLLQFVFKNQAILTTNWSWIYWDNRTEKPTISSALLQNETDKDFNNRISFLLKKESFTKVDLIRFSENCESVVENDNFCSIYFQDGANLMCFPNQGYWMKLELPANKKIYEYVDGKFFKSSLKLPSSPV